MPISARASAPGGSVMTRRSCPSSPARTSPADSTLVTRSPSGGPARAPWPGGYRSAPRCPTATWRASAAGKWSSRRTSFPPRCSTRLPRLTASPAPKAGRSATSSRTAPCITAPSGTRCRPRDYRRGPQLRPGAAAARAARQPGGPGATTAGLTVIAEAFADRAYNDDGTLVPRGRDGAVLTDPAVVAGRAVAMATGREIESAAGLVIRSVPVRYVFTGTPRARSRWRDRSGRPWRRPASRWRRSHEAGQARG